MGRTALLSLAAAICLSAGTAPPASEVLAGARKTAAEQHKSIFLIFHASW